MVAIALTVGGWFASKLITELIDYAKDQKKMQLGLKDELARLEEALPKIQAVLNAVDQGLIREENPPLEKWLWQLRDAADQADNVMDEMEYNAVKEKVEQVEKSKVSKAASGSRTFFQRAVYKDPTLKRLKEAVKAIDKAAVGVRDFYELANNLTKNQKECAISDRQTGSVSTEQTGIFGREKEKNNIIDKLLNPECKIKEINFSVLPIIGQGGVGKTTLAQLVYNDLRVQDHFELKMWICVSTKFDVELLTKKLYEYAYEKTPDVVDFGLIQSKLAEKLKSKRFLVVFDDAWNDNNRQGWEKLLGPLRSGDRGSMILLTTRMEIVAKSIGPNLMDQVSLEGLNEGDMWNILEGYVFGGKSLIYNLKLEEIGRDIVKRLKGSPLAAKTVGGILSSNLSEEHWKSVLENELWNLEQGQNDIMPALRLTYQYLPPYLKPCFSFCSIFSQDNVFVKNDLIYMWTALGLVPRSVNGAKRPEDVGSKYFNDMLNRSIFTRVTRNRTFSCTYSYRGGWQDLENKNQYFDGFVMHDLIHDLSTFVSKGECFRTNADKPVPIPNTVRHLHANVRDPCKLSISGLKNVRTLILDIDGSDHSDLHCIVTEILKGMENLRVLTIVAPNLSEFPESASNLLHLRYLNLFTFSLGEIPRSMSRLYLLETMVLYELLTSLLEKTDHVLGKLINLRHVIAPEQVVEKIAGVGRLTSLQELSFRVGKEGESNICEIGNMRELQRLSIEDVDKIGSCKEAIQADLKNKVSLCELSLEWSSQIEETEDTGFDEDVLDHLEPHSGLKELRITCHMGRRPPIWFGTQTLSNLVYLKIVNCNWNDLPCLEKRRFLKYVDFCDMSALKGIIHKCNQTSQVDGFPSLEVVSFKEMPAIEQWHLDGRPNKWMEWLRELTISDCPKLCVLPPLPLSLKKLKLSYLGLHVLPNLWEDRSTSGGLSSLVEMEIYQCYKLVSLAEGLLQNPKQFVALEKLIIDFSESLMYLPQGGFNKFISLKKLNIYRCPMIQGQLVQECYLPSSLQTLFIHLGGGLDITLPKALENVHSLSSLELYDCANVTSLPPKEVFSRWKTLTKLLIVDCPKLVSAISSPLPIRSSSMETTEEPLLSVDGLYIDDPVLLSIEPIRFFSVVRKLSIYDCSKLESLPEFPPSVKELSLYECNPKLLGRCENSGADWPKLSHIPKLIITRSRRSHAVLLQEMRAGADHT